MSRGTLRPRKRGVGVPAPEDTGTRNRTCATRCLTALAMAQRARLRKGGAPMRCRLVRVVLCGLVLSVVLASTGIASAATTPPRKELLHAINHVRAAYGMAKLMGAPALRAAALRHSEDMLARDYFAHTSPTGSTVAFRILRSGFVSGHVWRAGETLAWGIGARASAAATVA